MTRRVAAQEHFQGMDWSFSRGSIARICMSPTAFACARRDAEEFTSEGFTVSVLEQEQARAVMDGAAFLPDLVGIVHERDGFSADCGQFVRKLNTCCAEKFGCAFIGGTRAVALHTDGERVTSVETADGRRLSADLVVLANGAQA